MAGLFAYVSQFFLFLQVINIKSIASEMSEDPQNNIHRKPNLRNVSLKKLNRKYCFLMSHDESMEPIVAFRVNLMNIVVIAIATGVVLIALTAVLIAFTPLREYIPGYTDTSLERKVYTLNRRADSLENALHQQEQYFDNLKRIIEGNDTVTNINNAKN